MSESSGSSAKAIIVRDGDGGAWGPVSTGDYYEIGPAIFTSLRGTFTSQKHIERSTEAGAARGIGARVAAASDRENAIEVVDDISGGAADAD